MAMIVGDVVVVIVDDPFGRLPVFYFVDDCYVVSRTTMSV